MNHNAGNNQTFRNTLRHFVPAVLVLAGFGGYTTLTAPMALAQDATAPQDQAPAGQRGGLPDSQGRLSRFWEGCRVLAGGLSRPGGFSS